MSSLLSGLFWAAYGIVFAWTTLLVLALIRRERIISTVEFFFKHLGDCTGVSAVRFSRLITLYSHLA